MVFLVWSWQKTKPTASDYYVFQKKETDNTIWIEQEQSEMKSSLRSMRCPVRGLRGSRKRWDSNFNIMLFELVGIELFINIMMPDFLFN